MPIRKLRNTFLLATVSAAAVCALFAQDTTDLLRSRGTTQNIDAAQPSSQVSASPISLQDLRRADSSNTDLLQPIDQPGSATTSIDSVESKTPSVQDLSDCKAKRTNLTGKRKEGSSPSSKAGSGDTQPANAVAKYAPADDEPHTRQHQNPYANLPALRDLYQQLEASDQEPKRFGIDVFRTRTTREQSDSQLQGGFPSAASPDLPMDRNYQLGPGDGLTIDLWGGVSQRLTRTVDQEGRIVLPEAGTVVVAGKSLGEAQKLVEAVLGRQFRNIHAELSLAHLRSVRVYVVGEVEIPGAYDLSSVSTALNALYAAGGPNPRGSMRRLRHYRGTKLLEEIDLYEFLLLGVRQDTMRLEPGDTLQVPLAGPQITVRGMVKRPAIYELRNEKQLAQVIDLAGGLRNLANLKQISLERIEAHQRHSMINIAIAQVSTEAEISASLERFQIADGDRVTVSPIVPYNQAAVYLDGHVFQPGRFPFHEGMTVAELLSGRERLLPEPSDHVEVIHLSAPDFRPVVEELSLEQIFSGATIELHAFDTVRIFGRYEADAPKVAIYGEVLRPGEYPLSEGMTASALIRLAGGFKRGALRTSADLTSYVIQDGKLVTLAPRSLDLTQMMRGESHSDRLKPGDVVTIHQITGWNDIGASVVLEGEVMHPGTYGICKGERLSSVIQRAGGFRETAYPKGAQLERVDVRKLAEKNREELIQQLETAAALNRPDPKSDPQTLQAMHQQQQTLLQTLKDQPVSGRMAVSMTSDITKWQNSAADLEIKNGDVIRVPERPAYVMVSGQVFNPGAVTFVAGKDVDWYLRHAGGFSELANRKGVFLLRANGSVVGHTSSLFGGSLRSTRVEAGDSIVVPARIVGGTPVWRNLMDSAQVMSALAIAARVALSF